MMNPEVSRRMSRHPLATAVVMAAVLSAGRMAIAGGGDATALSAAGQYPVPPPPFSEDIFPCSGCHEDLEADTRRRELTDFHEEIGLAHGPRERWCFDCHDPDDRDVLRLASGETVPFTESYRLCGQCHGDKYRDWKVGVHGKRTGEWNGRKQYLLCAHCHDPHSPRFAPIEPMPPPVRPSLVRQKSRGAGLHDVQRLQQD